MKAYRQLSTEIREQFILGGFVKAIEYSRLLLDLRTNLGDADMTLDIALGIALHIESSTRIKED